MAKMIDNFAQFESAVSGFSKELEEQANDYKAMVTLTILDRVLDMSPVDTGRYRANWQVEIGHPKMRALKAKDKTSDRTLMKGTAVIERASLDDDIWITNNVVYAPFLEFGTATMKPFRILGRALALVESSVGLRRKGLRSAVKLEGEAGRRR